MRQHRYASFKDACDYCDERAPQPTREFIDWCHASACPGPKPATPEPRDWQAFVGQVTTAGPYEAIIAAIAPTSPPRPSNGRHDKVYCRCGECLAERTTALLTPSETEKLPMEGQKPEPVLSHDRASWDHSITFTARMGMRV